MDLSLGAKIKLLRAALDLSQAEFAERAGLSPFTIWNYENGKSNPRPDKIKQIEAVYNVDFESVSLVSGK